jgi:hypothetical protein
MRVSHNNGMQRTALGAAADAERYAQMILTNPFREIFAKQLKA